MSPASIASSTSGDRSNVANAISPSFPAWSSAGIAGVEADGPSVWTPSIESSAWSAPATVSVIPAGSFKSTGITFTFSPRPFSKPWQRRSSATFPTSWLMQMAFFTPSSANRWPAMSPASNSVCPTCTSTPSFANTSLPEFIEITGIPAATAALIEGPSASASGMLTTRPSGSEATAASISWLMATMSNVSGAWYATWTPMSSAAAFTPLAATDQNGSDAWPWVTTTNRKSRCFTAPPFSPSSPPPVHAAPKRASTSRTPAHFRRIIPPPFLRGNASSRVPLRHRHTGHGRFSGPHAQSLEELEARGDVHVARSERPVHPCRDGVPVSHPSRPHLLRQLGRDVLHMDVDHAVRRGLGELDGVGPPDHEMAGVHAERHRRGLQQPLHLLGSLDDRALMGMQGHRQAALGPEIGHPADPRHERRPRRVFQVRSGLVAVPAGAGREHEDLGTGPGQQLGLHGHPIELVLKPGRLVQDRRHEPGHERQPVVAQRRLEPRCVCGQIPVGAELGCAKAEAGHLGEDPLGLELVAPSRNLAHPPRDRSAGHAYNATTHPISSRRTGRCSARERPQAIAMRSAASASSAVHGLSRRPAASSTNHSISAR